MLGADAEGGERVKLLDFGIAKLLDGDAALTATGARLGTPSHMAPEQILGQRVGPATDVYALGVMLFQMLTGRLPFDASSSVEIEAKHLDAEPPRASEVARVPEPVSDVIARCLSKKPLQRYASAAELSADLEAAGSSPERDPLRAGSAEAVGIFAGLPDGSPGAAARLAAAQRALEAEGFAVVLGGEGWILGALLLPASAAEADQIRRRAGEAAVALADGQAPSITTVVHVAEVTTLLIEGTLELTGGPLFDVDAWARAGMRSVSDT
jgi:serine/threonine-protein kinase